MEHNQQAPQRQAAVVSGEEDQASSTAEEESVTSNDELRYGDSSLHADDLYGENMDDEDEAWVYKHMRGGIQEEVSIKTRDTTKKLKVLKPRNSDAVLSCPCCFTIVCMDCQRHEKYENQFRAMFVMNIGVDWNKRLVYSKHEKRLVVKPPVTVPANRVLEDSAPNNNAQQEVYYSVHCSSCQTEVAALNMEDEVYHFFGCLESA